MTPTEFAKLTRILRHLVNSTDENHEAVQLILELINGHSIVPGMETLNRGQGPPPQPPGGPGGFPAGGGQGQGQFPQQPRRWSGSYPVQGQPGESGGCQDQSTLLSPRGESIGYQDRRPSQGPAVGFNQNRPSTAGQGVRWSDRYQLGPHSPWTSFNTTDNDSTCLSSYHPSQPGQLPQAMSTPHTSGGCSTVSSSNDSVVWLICPHCNRRLNMKTNIQVDEPGSGSSPDEKKVRFCVTVVSDSDSSGNSSRPFGSGPSPPGSCGTVSSLNSSVVWVICPHCHRRLNMNANVLVDEPGNGSSPDETNVRLRLTVVSDSDLSGSSGRPGFNINGPSPQAMSTPYASGPSPPGNCGTASSSNDSVIWLICPHCHRRLNMKANVMADEPGSGPSPDETNVRFRLTVVNDSDSNGSQRPGSNNNCSG